MQRNHSKDLLKRLKEESDSHHLRWGDSLSGELPPAADSAKTTPSNAEPKKVSEFEGWWWQLPLFILFWVFLILFGNNGGNHSGGHGPHGDHDRDDDHRTERIIERPIIRGR